ncbi:hypothetical protein GQR58_028055 [Nymphon striatum]|nr:hypothetical protein GQR58_028055 [Nymphon striatum]
MSINILKNELDVAGSILAIPAETSEASENTIISTHMDTNVVIDQSSNEIHDVSAVALLHGEEMEVINEVVCGREEPAEEIEVINEVVCGREEPAEEIEVINEVVCGQEELAEEIVESSVHSEENAVSIDVSVEQAVAMLHADDPKPVDHNDLLINQDLSQQFVNDTNAKSVEEAVALLHADNTVIDETKSEIVCSQNNTSNAHVYSQNSNPENCTNVINQIKVIKKAIPANIPQMINSTNQEGSKTPTVFKILVNQSQPQSVKTPVRIISRSSNSDVRNPLSNTNKISAKPVKPPQSQDSQKFHLPIYSIDNNNMLKIDGHQNIFVIENSDNVINVGNVEQTVTTPQKIVRKKKEEEEIPDFLNDELKQAFRIIRDLMSDKAKNVNWPFKDAIDSSWPEAADYAQVIKKPMWLHKIRSNFLEKKYESITEPISDLRLLIENCYRYNGPDHTLSKKAIKIETMMEQKLALLSREYRDKTTFEATSEESTEDDQAGNQKRKLTRTLAEGGESQLLERVKHEKALRDKEIKRKQMEEKKAEKEAAYQKALDWENTLLNEANILEMKAMWELPQIGHFLYLTQAALNIPEVSQFELERILLMPRQSSILPMIMTSLLANPNARTNLDKRPPMKYKIWQQKLKQRVIKWYRILKSKHNQPLSVFEQVGVEPAFFSVMGLVNPFESKDFHDLTFHQRLWMVKSLCDYCLHTHKTIQEVIGEQNIIDQKEVILGSDLNGYIYIHFPQFCGLDLRIYKQIGWAPPSIDVPIVNNRGKFKAPTTRIAKKEDLLKKPSNNESTSVTTPYNRPSNLRQTLKPVKRDDMICESITNKYVANSETSDPNVVEDYIPPVDIMESDIDVASEEVIIPETETSSLSVTDENMPQEDTVDPEPISVEKDSEPDVKQKSEPRPVTPVPQTDLSKSIVDFDLEKELAISIRGRSGRKQKAGGKKRGRKSKKDSADSSEEKEADSTKSDEEVDKDNESQMETDIKTEDDEESDSNLDIKPENIKIETDTIKSEVPDDTDMEIKSEIKTEPEVTDEILDTFELNVQEYLTGGRYEEPNISNFELVVDSIESLKELIDRFIKEENFHTKDAKGRIRAPKFTRLQKNELELRERLCNLLEELEPWKDKLIQAVKRSVQKLKKEWDEYDPKSEEITGQDEWASDSDDEKSVEHTQKLSEKESEEEDGAVDISQRLKNRHLKAALKKKKKEKESAETQETALTVSSRGRVRKARVRNDIYDYGDDGDANANTNQKDSDKSDTFKPDMSKRRARKEAAMNAGDQDNSEKPEAGAKQKAKDSQKVRQVFTIEDGVLKAVNVSNLSEKQIIRKKPANNARILKKPKIKPNQSTPSNPILSSVLNNGTGGQNRILKIGDKSVVIPNFGNDPNAVRVIQIDGKTLIIKGQQAAALNSPVNVLKPLPTQPPTPPVVGSDTPLVQLHNASGHVQKVISLPEAQKLLVASKNSPISTAGGVKAAADGTIMVPVVDGQGKVSYLKMRKNAATDNPVTPQKPASEKLERVQTSLPQSSEKPKTQSNILGSIIQSEIGDLDATDSTQVQTDVNRKRVLKTVQMKPAKRMAKAIAVQNESTNQGIPNVHSVINLNSISNMPNQNSLLSIPINQLNQHNNVIKVANYSQGKNVFIKLPKSGLLPAGPQKGPSNIIKTKSESKNVSEAAAAVQNLLSCDFDKFSSEPLSEQLEQTFGVTNQAVSMPTIPPISISTPSSASTVKIISSESPVAAGTSILTSSINPSSNFNSLLQNRTVVVNSNSSPNTPGTGNTKAVSSSTLASVNVAKPFSSNSDIQNMGAATSNNSSPGKIKVIIKKGDQMIPMMINSEQLAGLSGGSYVLNMKSGLIQPVATKSPVASTKSESQQK